MRAGGGRVLGRGASRSARGRAGANEKRTLVLTRFYDSNQRNLDRPNTLSLS